jgi:hypothetical protein
MKALTCAMAICKDDEAANNLQAAPQQIKMECASTLAAMF